MKRTQTVTELRGYTEEWESFEVTTRSGPTFNEVQSRTVVRCCSFEGRPFVDLAIEEYTGISRRAKLTSVRLEEPAARRLYEALAHKFGGGEVDERSHGRNERNTP